MHWPPGLRQCVPDSMGQNVIEFGLEWVANRRAGTRGKRRERARQGRPGSLPRWGASSGQRRRPKGSPRKGALSLSLSLSLRVGARLMRSINWGHARLSTAARCAKDCLRALFWGQTWACSVHYFLHYFLHCFLHCFLHLFLHCFLHCFPRSLQSLVCSMHWAICSAACATHSLWAHCSPLGAESHSFAHCFGSEFWPLLLWRPFGCCLFFPASPAALKQVCTTVGWLEGGLAGLAGLVGRIVRPAGQLICIRPSETDWPAVGQWASLPVCQSASLPADDTRRRKRKRKRKSEEKGKGKLVASQWKARRQPQTEGQSRGERAADKLGRTLGHAWPLDDALN